MPTRVKICGVTRLEDALAAAAAGADAVGFVFVRASPRWIDPADAWDIVGRLPPFVATVGVFVNTGIDSFSDIEQRCPTHYAQLQGTEDERLVRQCGPGVIKGLRFHPDTIARELARWNAVEEVDAILVDGSGGGQGVAFDWPALRPHLQDITKPLILAGGLTPDNVARAIETLRPYAVDVSSGVESRPGIKDPIRIESFCRAVREADRS